MKNKTAGNSWNDYWNNYIRLCEVIEAYMTLCFAIKHSDIGFLRVALREVYIILQAPSAKKPKYVREMLRQLHIIDITTADPILQKAYPANALINP